MRRRRARKQGSTLFLIVLAALLLSILVYLGFQYCILIGASREVRNAVDASVLNISKRLVEVRANPGGGFNDCADTSGTVTVATLNRVWGKAYLINANIDEMKSERVLTPAAAGSGDLAYSMAQQVNDELMDRMTNKITLDSYFGHMSDKRRAALLGGATVNHATQYKYPTALVDRGAESNLSFNPKALPMSAMPSGIDLGDKHFLQGYTPFVANSKTFCFTPFRRGEMPHLISETDFHKNRTDIKPISDFNAVPNAYQGLGEATFGDTTLSASASGVINPQRQYDMTIPHSFIKVKFKNQSIWMIDDKIVNSLDYLPKPTRVWGIQDYKLKDERILNGWATLGKEFKQASVNDVLHVIPGNHDPALQRLLQRAQEIDPNFSMQRIVDLLQEQSVSPKTLTYYIFPAYATLDFTDPELDIAAHGSYLPEWLNHTAEPEGGEKEVVKEDPFLDNFNAMVVIKPGNQLCPKKVEISGSCVWQPGTGMGQCLGTLYVHRLTKVLFEPGTEKSGRGPLSL